MITLLVIDSGGIGAAPDAAEFGDQGANTLGHALGRKPFRLPHLVGLGLGRLVQWPGAAADVPPTGASAVIHPAARGKDTLAGHWEMMGVIVEHPFRTYPGGFPADVVARLEAAFGRPLLGNRAASGTAIIAELGAEHMATGRPIVYTSADSVLQIACHEEVVPVETLYDWCHAARTIMTGPNLVGRIIARPFVGEPGHFVRTPRRHDYAVEPPSGIFTERFAAAGVHLEAVGKIWDIFSGRGFETPHPTVSNADGLRQTGELMRALCGQRAFVFANLVDFDSQYGHRRDPEGYARALAELDDAVPELLAALGPADQLWITADHGCDPTWPGSDHTRENVPLLVGGPRVRPGLLAARNTLADIGQSLGQAFGTPLPAVGRSFWEEVTA